MDQGLFRKAAIDKMSSPDQLDLLMRVTSPIGWLALLTLGVMIAVAAAWAATGSVADLVDGQGTLFRGERLVDVKATMAGTLVEFKVRPGAIVAAGETVASIRRDRAGIEERAADAITIEKNEAMAARKREALAALRRSRALQQKLVDQGLKAPLEMIALDREIIGVEGEVAAYEQEARAVRSRMVATAEVKSAESGRVVEVMKSAGDKVSEDEPLFRLEPARKSGGAYCDGNVHVILYVPAAVAGRVRPGQEARVSPSDVKREEYGYIRGRVAWVSSYPASTADMTEKLKNDQLVRSFMSLGPAFEARVCLERDPANAYNQFRWSSSRGPARSIDAGTPATASVVVERRRPYTYLIPAMKRAAGI